MRESGEHLLSLFFVCSEKIFWLDVLISNTFKEIGEMLGRKSIEMRKRTC